MLKFGIEGSLIELMLTSVLGAVFFGAAFLTKLTLSSSGAPIILIPRVSGSGDSALKSKSSS